MNTKGTMLKAAVLLVSGALAAWSAAIAPVPVATSVQVGQTFDVSVDVTDVTMSGYGFDVEWQPGLLELTSISAANIFAPLLTVQFFPPTPAASGVAFGLAESVIGPGSFTGSGTLVTLTFRALAMGDTSIDLTNVLLLDDLGDPFNVDVGSARVMVGVVPEPATGLLLAASLCLAAVARFRLTR